MAYQVLARKWRPKNFETLVGQEHVVRALSHALTEQRLHHAYLFTGTRGVGKTTLARILAKSLNCEKGITPQPCGQCSACLEIDSGRFVDLLEVDAATNTRVEEMRQLLENAVYAPTRARYKVYVIDEVHMLSNSAFNAMLKTLEEPPEHIKFILATTDPQKIPVTVLSRCLQFNLKQMTVSSIVSHLTRLLEAENVPFERTALGLLAKAASGSMRDALSLLDQAIAHGAGQVMSEAVSAMLGAVENDHLFLILDALHTRQPDALLAVSDRLVERSLSFDAALQELAALLTRIQIAQFSDHALSDEDIDTPRLKDLATRFDPEHVQLLYQIAILGRKELPLAPDPQAGFTMTMLRMLAFAPETGTPTRPHGGGGSGKIPGAPPKRSPGNPGTPEPAGATPLATSSVVPPVVPVVAPSGVTSASTTVSDASAPAPASSAPAPSLPPPWEDLPTTPPPLPQISSPEPQPVSLTAPPLPPPVSAAVSTAVSAPSQPSPPSDPAPARPPVTLNASCWLELVARIDLGGMVGALLQQCEFRDFDEATHRLRLRLPPMHRHLLMNGQQSRDRIAGALAPHLGLPESTLRVEIETAEPEGDTPARVARREKEQRQAAAIEALESDPKVRELIELFDARLIESSVQPLTSS